MDFEICKKCKNKRELYFIALNPPSDDNTKGDVILSAQHCFMLGEKILDNRAFFEYRHNKSRYISFEAIKKEFPSITVNELCPYYLEHQLTDWNTK
jgi:hypothetical protein